jgi:hypothetical protein
MNGRAKVNLKVEGEDLAIKTILTLELLTTPTNLIRNQIIFKLIYPITLTRKICP